jgi:8-oxo-dGTP diphosphatase
MNRYSKQTRILVAVDCIVFGFDQNEIKILLVQRGLEPEKGKWSLMGGFVEPEESLEMAADRVLLQLTGLEDVYMEQLHAFGHPLRDPIERTISVAYFALLDLNKFEPRLSQEYHAEWFPLKAFPPVIFDHSEMIKMARSRLRYKASLHPILFELLPAKFTLPQLQNLFEDVYETTFDKRNFSRKMLSTTLIIKQKEKDKSGSKKGAYYYKLNRKNYRQHFQKILHFIPNPNKLI